MLFALVDRSDSYLVETLFGKKIEPFQRVSIETSMIDRWAVTPVNPRQKLLHDTGIGQLVGARLYFIA